MAKLYFKYGAMGSSKTANALITKFNYEERGMRVWLIKPSIDDRDGADVIRSRIGLEQRAQIITPDMDIFEEFKSHVSTHAIIADECQFFTSAQIDQLRKIVDELEIPVKAKFDGEYVEKMSFAFDCKCFFGTFLSVLRSEGVVEGGITRMMWLYADVTKMPKVGPVRSARHDYVEIAQGMNAIYVHWGGSNLAYNKIREIGMKDIDGLKDGAYFKRDSSRSSRGTEHTGYTTGEYIAKAIANKKLTTKVKDDNWTMFKVVEEGVRLPFGGASGGANEVNVTFNGGSSKALCIGGCSGYSPSATVTDIHNCGVVTVGKDSQCIQATYLGGVFGYSKGGTLTRVSTSNKEGVKYGVVFSRIASKTGGSCDLRIGGIAGRIAGTLKTAELINNTAGIYIDGYQLGTSGLSVGGITGILNDSEHVFNGLVHNSGEIYYAGRCPKSNFGFGGCFANTGSKAKTFENVVNTGDIFVYKKFDDAYPTAPEKSMQIGGIVGFITSGVVLTNAICHCNLFAENAYSERDIEGTKYINSVGFISGVLRDANTPQLLNCKVGGTISTTTEEKESSDGSVSTVPKVVEITADNFQDYIYGGTTAWEGTDYDGCSFLSVKPTI